LTNSYFLKHILLNHFARTNEHFARRYAIATVDYFIGVSYTARMTLATVQAGLRAVPCGSVEVLLHPTIGPDPRDAACPNRPVTHYASAKSRATELETLQTPRLKEYLHENGWKVMSYGAWAEMQQERRPVEATPEIPAEVHIICQNAAVPAPVWISVAQDDSRAFAELVISQAVPHEHVLDVGTGSGIIAICVAKAGRRVTAIDLSRAAVRVARRNAALNGVQFESHHSDLLSKVKDRFDLIAFNPPYNFCRDTFIVNIAKNLLRRVPWVRRQSGLAMPRTVLRFHQELISRLIKTAPAHLQPGGRILIHAYESEVDALCDVLPEGTQVELLRHAALADHTVGLLIRPATI
jgi:release factor glutamine methyltransferase